MSRPLQYGFAEQYGEAAFDRAQRERKAAKVLAILGDAVGRLEELDMLDVGCSTGYMTQLYARHFRWVLGTDIDSPAVAHAARSAGSNAHNLGWAIMDSQRLALPSRCLDVVACTHIYEHVPDAKQLMAEIHRVLRPGGVCFFSAGNRLSLMEPHYRLPLLSVLPKWVAHLYLRVLGRGHHYYETHLTYWGLKRLVSAFDLYDYTIEVVADPHRYHADDLVTPGSWKQTTARLALRWLYWACPTYLWVLRKPVSSRGLEQ